MEPFSAGIMAGGSLLGGIMRNKSAKAAAARQMAFQKEMSNTSYQRGMDDMKKAGLNPILAGKVGGASTPTGSTYNPENVATGAMNAIAQSANAHTAIQNARLAQQNADYFDKKPYGSAVLNARPANIFLTELIERNPHLMQELSQSIGTSSKALLSLLSGDLSGVFSANNTTSKDKTPPKIIKKLSNMPIKKAPIDKVKNTTPNSYKFKNWYKDKKRWWN